MFLTALWWLEKHYGIKHIRISRYNSCANGIVECTHYDVQESVFKACDRDENWWSVFWAEHITIWKCMGHLPYSGAYRAHLLLPLDIVESNYLLPLRASSLMSMELISCQAISLQKHPAQLAKLHDKFYSAQVQAEVCFEKEHTHMICDFNFKLGDLVLVQNTATEKALNRKMWCWYLGPLIVISRNQWGAYIRACSAAPQITNSQTILFVLDGFPVAVAVGL